MPVCTPGYSRCSMSICALIILAMSSLSVYTLVVLYCSSCLFNVLLLFYILPVCLYSCNSIFCLSVCLYCCHTMLCMSFCTLLSLSCLSDFIFCHFMSLFLYPCLCFSSCHIVSLDSCAVVSHSVNRCVFVF